MFADPRFPPPSSPRNCCSMSTLSGSFTSLTLCTRPIWSLLMYSFISLMAFRTFSSSAGIIFDSASDAKSCFLFTATSVQRFIDSPIICSIRPMQIFKSVVCIRHITALLH